MKKIQGYEFKLASTRKNMPVACEKQNHRLACASAVTDQRLYFSPYKKYLAHVSASDFCLFDLILYVHSTIFQLCGTCLPGLNTDI